jgi:hypothetical protein
VSRGVVVRLGSVVCAALALVGCVSPAPDEASYSDKAAMTAGAAASEVSTVRLTTQLLLADRLQRNYGDVTISASEDALSSVSQTFSVVQPPDKTSDQVRAELEQLLGDAADAVAAARIANRRDDHPAMRKAAADLGKSATQLQAAEKRYG